MQVKFDLPSIAKVAKKNPDNHWINEAQVFRHSRWWKQTIIGN